jgi:hypothetical protein
MLHRIVFLVVAVSTVGCAARLEGELDGRTVPTFQTAAFGAFSASPSGYSVMGFFSAGNSCDDGADLTRAQRRWSTAFDVDERQARAERWAELINERLPERSWYGQLSLFAADDDDLDDAEVDLSEQRDVFLSGFQLCQRSGDAIAVDGIIQTGDDCYIAIDGDIDITRNDQETELTLVSERTIEFIDETGDEEGDLTISITMTECEPLSEEVEATVSPS